MSRLTEEEREKIHRVRNSITKVRRELTNIRRDMGCVNSKDTLRDVEGGLTLALISLHWVQHDE